MQTVSSNTTHPGFKLVQITDCHLLAEPEALLKQVSPHQTLRRVCDAVRSSHADANILLFTGDISQDGSRASYVHFLDAVESIDIDAYALAGNHDDLKVMQASLPPRIKLDKSLIQGHWRIVLLNSRIESAVAGRLQPDELEWLQQQLDTFPEQYVLIALHHQPITTGSDWMDQIGLQNAEELQTLLTNYPQVRLLLHGHTHQASCCQWSQIACYGTPSSWRQFVANSQTHRMEFLPPAYRVIELFDNGSHRSWIEFV